MDLRKLQLKILRYQMRLSIDNPLWDVLSFAVNKINDWRIKGRLFFI